MPLSDTMKAADALAGGDLSARVPVRVAASSATWPTRSTEWPGRSRSPTGNAVSCWPMSLTSYAPR